MTGYETELDADVRRPRRARKWILGGLAVLVVAAVAVVGYRVVVGKTSAPFYEKMMAEQARAEMRKQQAERWAPNAAPAAEAALREALAAYRVEDETFLAWRDFDPVKAALLIAHGRIEQATRVAVAERERAYAESEDAMRRAATSLGEAEQIARSLPLSRYERTAYSRASMALGEARYLHANGDPLAARQRAQLAQMQAQSVAERAVLVAQRFVDPVMLRRWRGWIDETVAQSARSGGLALVVVKESHTMTLYRDGRPVRNWTVELGTHAVRDKVYQGDNATPEGRYRVIGKRPSSMYHKALDINYPNDEDRAQFARMRRAGEVRSSSPGFGIQIHGGGGRGKDWTNGCIAVSDREMDDLFARIPVGTPVTIVGSDGSAGVFTNIVKARRSAAAGTPAN